MIHRFDFGRPRYWRENGRFTIQFTKNAGKEIPEQNSNASTSLPYPPATARADAMVSIVSFVFMCSNASITASWTLASKPSVT